MIVTLRHSRLTGLACFYFSWRYTDNSIAWLCCDTIENLTRAEQPL